MQFSAPRRRALFAATGAVALAVLPLRRALAETSDIPAAYSEKDRLFIVGLSGSHQFQLTAAATAARRAEARDIADWARQLAQQQRQALADLSALADDRSVQWAHEPRPDDVGVLRALEHVRHFDATYLDVVQRDLRTAYLWAASTRRRSGDAGLRALATREAAMLQAQRREARALAARRD